MGGGNGQTKGRREGVEGIVKSLRLGPLGGRGEEEAARRGTSWGPSRAGPRVCTIRFAIKTQNLPAGVTEFMCVSAVLGEGVGAALSACPLGLS